MFAEGGDHPAQLALFPGDRVRALLAAGDCIERYCDASLSVCEQRDVKGLYQKARRGEISEFTGISSPYEVPEKPEIVVLTGELDVETCAGQIINYLQQTGKIPGRAGYRRTK